MLLLISYLNQDSESLNYMQFFLLNEPEAKVEGYYGSRKKCTVLENVTEPSLFFSSLLLLMSYLNDLHLNKKLFHGDIKPANIFLELDAYTITTDCGSLIPLYYTEE